MINVFDPEITEDDIRAVTECLQRKELSGRSPIVAQFERDFAQYCGASDAISVNSGSSALFLALEALQLEKGSLVAVPSFGYIAVPNAVVQAGYTPYFVDVDTKTGNIDVEVFKRAARRNPIRAVVVIHTYGFPVDMPRLCDFTTENDIYVIEDAAEAHGASIGGMKVGSMGDVGCFSFFANKIITTGEGGMVVTSNKVLAERIRKTKDQFNTGKRYFHEELGYSLCLSAIQAALGLSQLKRIDEIVRRKREIAAYYTKNLVGVSPLRGDFNTEPVYWAYGVTTPLRDDLMFRLADRGISTRPFFPAYHNQEAYRMRTYKNAQWLQDNGLYLPSSHLLTNDQLDYVIETINEFCEERGA